MGCSYKWWPGRWGWWLLWWPATNYGFARSRFGNWDCGSLPQSQPRAHQQHEDVRKPERGWIACVPPHLLVAYFRFATRRIKSSNVPSRAMPNIACFSFPSPVVGKWWKTHHVIRWCIDWRWTQTRKQGKRYVDDVPLAMTSWREFASQSARVRSMATTWSVSDATTTTLDVEDCGSPFN